MRDPWPWLVVAAFGLLCVMAFWLLYKHIPGKQRVPTEYQLLAWFGLVAALGGAVCFAIAAFLLER